VSRIEEVNKTRNSLLLNKHKESVLKEEKYKIGDSIFTESSRSQNDEGEENKEAKS
jgi:hypothetical protein